MMNFREKTVTVIGLGKSGFSAAKLLKRLGAEVRVTDNQSSKIIEKRCKELKNSGIEHIEIGHHTKGILDDSHLVIVSPGVMSDNILIKEAADRNIPVISEIELGYLNCDAVIVAITGTNGKTTTSTLFYEILKQANKDPILCGNIGKPLCDIADKATTANIIVLEVSSFQLMYIDKFRPKVSAVLNIAPDHLDHHQNIKEYYRSKSRIFLNQSEDDFCILRRKDYEDIFLQNKIKPQVKLISKEKASDIFIDQKGYIIKDNDRYVHSSQINTSGAKSQENILFLLALSDIFKIKKELIIKTINSFKGLPHRLEEVGIFKGIRYVNDSKATNVAATELALDSIEQPIVLIAGGQYKDVDIFHLDLGFLKKVKHIVLFGQSKQMMYEAFKGSCSVSLVDDLYKATEVAKEKVQVGDCILFSPMCASFDQFNNFEERGEKFKKYAKKLNRQNRV
jgi:UDP-N-acetylmuramoylalanine--D-glutamate ligase